MLRLSQTSTGLAQAASERPGSEIARLAERVERSAGTMETGPKIRPEGLSGGSRQYYLIIFQ